MTKFTKFLAGAAAAGAMCFATQAGAVNLSVQFACASDYFKYCSKHRVGSKGVRTCMSHHGPRLSKRCINALVKAGEVSQAEVNRRAKRQRRASRRK